MPASGPSIFLGAWVRGGWVDHLFCVREQSGLDVLNDCEKSRYGARGKAANDSNWPEAVR